MAQITFGMGTSHSPMLSTPYEDFAGHAVRDRQNPDIKDVFEHYARERAPWIGEQLAPTLTKSRHEAVQVAIDRLSDELQRADVDTLVIVGDDQEEWFTRDSQPALAIYWGEVVESLPPPLEAMGPTLQRAYWGHYGDGQNRAYPVDHELALYLIEHLVRDASFDVTHIRSQPRDVPFGHAWSFVHQRLMRDKIIPIVPVLLNTYYPPNQPTPRRCYELGRAIRRLVESWPSDRKVGVVGSGGLSHFIVEEELDQAVLKALREKDMTQIEQIPTEKLNSGNSEIRNWITAGGALEHLDMELIDYVPSYRSEAGSGGGWAFAVWK